MSDLTLATQLQQWTFDKSTRTDRPASSASSSSPSPKLSDDLPYTLRIDTSVASHPIPASRKESVVLQERYLSSEEHLSSLNDGSSSEYESDFDYEDDVSIHDGSKEFKARTMAISRWDKGRSCDMATVVSYSFVGRPKVVELASDCRFPPHSRPLRQQRSVSVANVPNAAISKLRELEKAQRLSMDVLSSIPSSKTLASDRSASPAPRPSTSTFDSRLGLTTTQSLTVSSPALSFLSSDPYENSNSSPASPMNKRPGHQRRLRSISMKLALAKIAITPSKKSNESRTPSTPYGNTTPLTPAAETSASVSSPNKLRSASILRPKSRHSEMFTVSTPKSTPPVPFFSQNQVNKMVPRGADEREPPLVLPPFPDSAEDEASATKFSRKLRRRKSMMDLF